MGNQKIFLDITGALGLGDTICSTPVIRKLFNAYRQKINLITNYPEFFKNNPHVDFIFSPGDIDVNYVKKMHKYHSSFYNTGNMNEFNVQNKHNIIDIRQYHAFLLGFQLLNDEMGMDYYPEPFEHIENLPEKYVLIHPVQTWASRTWSPEKWMELTRRLNEQGIHVVSTGKDSSEIGGSNVQKPVFNFDIELGLNLMNKCGLPQTWHLIDKAACIVTMDSGLLHLAGTTDTNIIQLGSSINYKLRAPYRNGNQEYKYHYVGGGCNISCASDMFYGVREWNSIHGVPSLVRCLENKETFECHPSVDKVFDKVMEII